MIEVHLLERVLGLGDLRLQPGCWLAGCIVVHRLLTLQLSDSLLGFRLVLTEAQRWVVRRYFRLDHRRSNEPSRLLGLTRCLSLLLLFGLIVGLFRAFAFTLWRSLVHGSDELVTLQDGLVSLDYATPDQAKLDLVCLLAVEALLVV